MNEDNHDRTIRQRLDEELESLHFTQTQKVLQRTHPTTWRERFMSFWNKELEINVIPLGLASAFLITLAAIHAVQPSEKKQAATQEQELIEAGGNIYWKDELEKAVAHYENQNKS